MIAAPRQDHLAALAAAFERRVAVADAVWAMFEDGLIEKTSANVLRAAAAAGVTVADLRDADYRKTKGAPARRLVVMPQKAPHQPNTLPATETRLQTKNPRPGRRLCSRCGAEKPVGDFAIKNRETGTRKSMCRPCMKDYQRTRYLTVEKLRLMNEASLTFVVTEGDGVTGLVCVDCGCPLRPGEQVVGHTALRHTTCPVRPAPLPEAHRVRFTQ